MLSSIKSDDSHAVHKGGLSLYHIIINPAAGQKKGYLLLPGLTAQLKTHGIRYIELFTQGPLDASKMARYACASGSEGIIAVGGDGTIQEIVTGMMEFAAGAKVIPTPLGIMPCGSGNDFVLTLTKGKRNARKVLEDAAAFTQNLLHNRAQSIDLIRVDNMACLNIANVGLDARIVHNAAGLKKYFQRNAYFMSSFKSILQHQNVKLSVTINNEVFDGAFTLAAVCNGQYYGGGMRIAPRAAINDGKITVCLVEGMSRPKAFALFPSVLVEKHVLFKEVRFFDCKSLSITLSEPAEFCLDGNLYERSGTLQFKVMPGALKLFQSF